jgi:hypothetical protein
MLPTTLPAGEAKGSAVGLRYEWLLLEGGVLEREVGSSLYVRPRGGEGPSEGASDGPGEGVPRMRS